MEMIPVSSSNIDYVGYDSSSRELYISFHHGGTYVYFGVPESVYNELMGAESHGKYHAANIKHSYPYRRL